MKDQRELTAACEKHQFDVAVIGQTVSDQMKRIIAALVRKECPAAKILELHSQYGAKAVEDADAWLKTPADMPRDLAQRVTELAEEKSRT